MMNDKAKILRDYSRMCDSTSCNNCGIVKLIDTGERLYGHICCIEIMVKHPEEAVKAIEEWAKKHPIKTRQNVFLERYPNAGVGENGTLTICPIFIDNDEFCRRGGCLACRDNYWLQEVAE